MIKVLTSITILLTQIAGLIAAIKGDTAMVVWCVSNQALVLFVLFVHSISHPENK